MSGIFHNLTEQQAKAFLRIKNDASIGGILLPLLANFNAKLIAASLNMEGAELHRTQGKIIAINDLINTIEDAVKHIPKNP